MVFFHRQFAPQVLFDAVSTFSAVASQELLLLCDALRTLINPTKKGLDDVSSGAFWGSTSFRSPMSDYELKLLVRGTVAARMLLHMSNPTQALETARRFMSHCSEFDSGELWAGENRVEVVVPQWPAVGG